MQRFVVNLLSSVLKTTFTKNNPINPYQQPWPIDCGQMFTKTTHATPPITQVRFLLFSIEFRIIQC